MGNLCSCVGGVQDEGVTDASRSSRPRSRIPGAATGTLKSVDADGHNMPPIKRVSYVPRLDALHEEHSRQGGSVQLGPAMQAVLGLGGAAPRSAPKLLTGAASTGSIDSGTLWGFTRAAASIHRDSLQLHRRDSSMSAQFPLVPAARSNSIDRRMSVASMHSEALAGTAGTGAGSGTGTGGAGTPYFGSRNPSERRMSTTATPLAPSSLSGRNSQVKQTDRLVIDQVKDNVFINQYLIIKDLGKGAHGTVKLVYNTEDDMLYAMKVVAHKSWPAHVSSYLGMSSGHLAQQQQQQQQRLSPQQLPQMPQQVPSNLSNRSSNMSSSISAHTSSSHSTSLNHPLYQRQHASAGAGTGPGGGMLMARGRTPSSTAIMVHVDGEDRRSGGSAHGGRSVSVAGSGNASSSGSGAGGGAGGAGGGGAYAPSRSSYMSPSASTPSLAIPVRRNASRLGPIPPPAAPSTGQAGIAPLERGPSASQLLAKQHAQQAPTALDFGRYSSYARGSPNSPQPRGSAPCSPAMPATGQQQAQQAQQQGANLPLASSISLSRNSSLPYYGGLPESPQNEPGTSAGAGARGPPSLAFGSIQPMARSGSLPRAIGGQPPLPHQQPHLCDSPTRKASMPELGQQPGVAPWGDQRLEPMVSSVGDGSCNNYYSELPPPPTSSSSPPPPPSQQQHSAALSRLGSGAASASMRPPGLLTFPVGGSATQLASVGSPPGALLQRSRQPPRRVGSEAGLGHLDSGQQRAGPGGRLGAGGGWTQLGAQYSNEIMVMKELDHPNVVKLYEVIANPANRRVLMLMEYVEGGCVLQAAGSSASGRKEPIQEQVALRYFRDVLQGLDYLHFNSIVHGDLKPDNLLLTMSAKVKISDFGSARMCGPDELLVKSVGTPSFTAPEMCAGLPFNGFAGDIWALGVCLFMFLYGTMPFTGKNSYQVYEAVQKQELLFPKPKPGLEVSVDVKHLITRLLEKSPSERATLEEVMQHPWVTRGGAQPLPSCSDLHVGRVCEELRGRNTATATCVVEGSPEAGPGTDEQQQQRTAHVSGGRGRAHGIGQQAFGRVLEPPMDAHTAPMPTSLVAVTSPAKPAAKPAAAPATAPAGAEAAGAKPRPGRAPSGRGLPVGLPLIMKSALTGGIGSPARKGVMPLAAETSGTAQAEGQQTRGGASSQAVGAQAGCSTSTPSTPCGVDCPGPSVWEEDMQELLELLPGAQERVYEDGQHLIKLDEPAEGLFLLLEGCCDLMRRAGQRKYVADEDFADVLVDDDDDDQRLSDELQAVGAAPHETEYSAHDIHVPGLQGVGLSAIMLSTALPGVSERPSAFPLSPHAGRGGAGDDDGNGSGLFVLGERQESSMTGLAQEGSDGGNGGKEEEGADALAAASGWPVLQLGDVGFSERGTPLAAALGSGLSSTGGAAGRTPPLPPSVSAPNARPPLGGGGDDAPSGRAAAVAGAACEDADAAMTAAWMALRPDSLDSVPGLVSAPLAHLAQSLSLFSNPPDGMQHAASAYGGPGERPARLPTRGASCALPAPSPYSRYSTALQLGRTSQALDGGEGQGPTVSSVLSNFVATSMKLPDVVVHSGRIERAMVRSDSMQERMDNMLMRAKPFANTEVRQGAKHLVCRRGPGTVLGDVCLDGRKPRKSETAVVARGRVTALLIPHEIIRMHMSSATGHPVVRAALNRSANALLVQEAMERFVECESEVRFSRKVRDHAAAGLRFWLAADAQQQQQQRRQQSQLLPHRPSHDGLGRAAGGVGYAGSSRIGRRSRSGSPQLHYTLGDLGLFRRSEI